jgi:hypothetical protein
MLPVSIVLLLALSVLTIWGQQQLPKQAGADPQFTQDNQLIKPNNYREWIWLTSGSGMAYTAPPANSGKVNPAFDNVFVLPEAYKEFLKTGKWPDKTVLVLEIREAKNNGSINKNGYFQGRVYSIEAEVKDLKRFPNGWGFFGFEQNSNLGKPFPEGSECHTCHSEHGAVDNTFVQFYPTLLDVARKKGTIQHPAEVEASNSSGTH